MVAQLFQVLLQIDLNYQVVFLVLTQGMEILIYGVFQRNIIHHMLQLQTLGVLNGMEIVINLDL